MHRSALTYAQVIRLPNVLALLASTTLARLAGRMFAVAIVFHALAAFGSPSLAGWISFAAMAPGLAISPLAGAFLDRAGASRGIVIDLAVSAALMLALAVAVLLHQATPLVLLVLAAAYALTSPLSAAGVRVVLPRLVPTEGLDKANALDTAIHGVVDVVGPSLGGTLIGFLGPFPTFVTIAIAYAAATVGIALIQGAATSPSSSGDFLRQAMGGLMVVVRRPLLRGLAVGYSLNNLTWGILIVAVPVAVARHFDSGAWQSVSGLLWAGSGVAGGIGALGAGHLRLYGREVRVMTVSMVVTAVAVWPIATFGLTGLALGLALTGLLAGPIDVGLLTLRQRRTDLAQLGRVLAVSMSINTAGMPIGTALGGMLVAWWPASALPVACLASLMGALATWVLIPAEDRAP